MLTVNTLRNAQDVVPLIMHEKEDAMEAAQHFTNVLNALSPDNMRDYMGGVLHARNNVVQESGGDCSSMKCDPDLYPYLELFNAEVMEQLMVFYHMATVMSTMETVPLHEARPHLNQVLDYLDNYVDQSAFDNSGLCNYFTSLMHTLQSIQQKNPTC